MTFFHFGNCVALAYVPYVMVYKFSGLAEYGVFWKCIQAGIMYLLTQLCKMLILASFFPATDTGAPFDVTSEFLKSTVELADLVGLYLVMLKVAGKGETKFLVAGLGWASAEVLMTRSVPLLFGARGIEFDWKYIQMSFDSNINLIHHISTATLVWLWSRQGLRKPHLMMVIILLTVACYRPLIMELITYTLGLASWPVLIVKLIGTISIGLIAMHIYLSLTQALNSY